MRIIPTFLTLTFPLLLCGCGEFTTGVLVGKLSTGEPVDGRRVTNPHNFEYLILFKEQRCTGTVSGLILAQETVLQLSCKNGVTGVANVRREKAYTEGRAVFRLSDGTAGQFGFAV